MTSLARVFRAVIGASLIALLPTSNVLGHGVDVHPQVNSAVPPTCTVVEAAPSYNPTFVITVTCTVSAGTTNTLAGRPCTTVDSTATCIVQLEPDIGFEAVFVSVGENGESTSTPVMVRRLPTQEPYCVAEPDVASPGQIVTIRCGRGSAAVSLQVDGQISCWSDAEFLSCSVVAPASTPSDLLPVTLVDESGYSYQDDAYLKIRTLPSTGAPSLQLALIAAAVLIVGGALLRVAGPAGRRQTP